MPFSIDSELLAVIQAMPARPASAPPLTRGDWKTLRASIEASFATMSSALRPVPGVSTRDVDAEGADGARVPMRWFTRDGAQPGSAVVYFHGGGMILGSVDMFSPFVAYYVAQTGVPMLSVDYRLAPEHPHPTPVEDAYAGLAWLVENASDLGVDPDRIAVMGDSAGGGIAAGVTLLARDRGVSIARQILVYPMLDDRTVDPDPVLAPFAAWSYDMNHTGWTALLGERRGTDTVPPAAAPARATDLSGLPTAYIEVGELDIFRDEDIDYARRLTAVGTSVELHVHPGCPHGFDRMAPHAGVVVRAMADRARVIASL